MKQGFIIRQGALDGVEAFLSVARHRGFRRELRRADHDPPLRIAKMAGYAGACHLYASAVALIGAALCADPVGSNPPYGLASRSAGVIGTILCARNSSSRLLQ